MRPKGDRTISSLFSVQGEQTKAAKAGYGEKVWLQHKALQSRSVLYIQG